MLDSYLIINIIFIKLLPTASSIKEFNEPIQKNVDKTSIWNVQNDKIAQIWYIINPNGYSTLRCTFLSCNLTLPKISLKIFDNNIYGCDNICLITVLLHLHYYSYCHIHYYSYCHLHYYSYCHLQDICVFIKKGKLIFTIKLCVCMCVKCFFLGLSVSFYSLKVHC